MSEDLVNIEVNGVALKARKNEIIMRVTDREGIYIPRFCYHDKLPIAANCRMCLVEVEKAPKPLPACATPVAEGMKIFTHSVKAIGAQRATMEFLLINHPLDCPICDQGGECELQDLALGFWPRHLALRRAQARGQGQEPGSAGVHRHDALHSLHALHTLRRRYRRHPGDWAPPAAASTWRSAPTSSAASITSSRATSSICVRSARSTASRFAIAAAAGR
jgi:hypothetical protein